MMLTLWSTVVLFAVSFVCGWLSGAIFTARKMNLKHELESSHFTKRFEEPKRQFVQRAQPVREPGRGSRVSMAHMSQKRKFK